MQTLVSGTDPAAFGWTEYHYLVVAAGASTVLQFGFRNDPSYFHLDDVSLTATAVPEPATLLLLGLGLTGLAGVGRKFKD